MESTISLKKDKKVILIGGGGSGKDFWKSKLKDMGYKMDVSYTSREPRDGEIDGISYNFISEDEFLLMIENGEFLQWNKFGNGKYYGTHRGSFATNDLFILTPNKVIPLIESGEIKDDCIIVYLNPSVRTRIERMISRGDVDVDVEIERRTKTDIIDFKTTESDLIKLCKGNGKPELIIISYPTSVEIL